jgi:hypothetical protein
MGVRFGGVEVMNRDTGFEEGRAVGSEEGVLWLLFSG